MVCSEDSSFKTAAEASVAPWASVAESSFKILRYEGRRARISRRFLGSSDATRVTVPFSSSLAVVMSYIKRNSEINDDNYYF